VNLAVLEYIIVVLTRFEKKGVQYMNLLVTPVPQIVPNDLHQPRILHHKTHIKIRTVYHDPFFIASSASSLSALFVASMAA
jgi:hypothetical protein